MKKRMFRQLHEQPVEEVKEEVKEVKRTRRTKKEDQIMEEDAVEYNELSEQDNKGVMNE